MPRRILTLHRVQAIASTLSLSVDLVPLRKSIGSLQATSLQLDIEKHDAEEQLVEAIKKSHQLPASRIARKVWCHLKAILGMGECVQSSAVPALDVFKAWKRVRSVNQKLRAFEQGLLSEEGIPDREWYRHLGVAPGKWLGKYCDGISGR
jgi:N-acetylated-alpha-linked acidic dipeptidase